MEKEKRRSLTINGIGSSQGGEVHQAKIDGIGRVDGDIVCTGFVINGKADVHGSVQASTAEMNGTASIQGGLRAQRVRINGKVAVDGDLSGESVHIHGSVTVKGKCEAEKLEANGRLLVGQLNAGDLYFTLHGSSEIGEIGGGQIRIRRQPGIDFARWLRMLPLPLGNRLTAQTIEGDSVYVEYTTAEVVRGAEVTVGPGCEIERVEYSQKLTRDKDAKIKKLERL